MLKDKVTNKTYSSGSAARRELGTMEFNRKVKKNELEYIEVS